MAKKATLRIVLERLQSLIQFVEAEADPEVHPPGCWCHNLCGARKVCQQGFQSSIEVCICFRSKGHNELHYGVSPNGSSFYWKDPVPNATSNYATLEIKEKK